MVSRILQFQQQAERIQEEESDFYALLIYQVLVNLLPDKSPKEIADEVLNAYKACQGSDDDG